MSDQEAIASALEDLQPDLDRGRVDVSTRLVELHQAEIEALYRQDHGYGPSEGKVALVVTSGVPGAGKSSFVEAHLDADRYFHVDPDEVRVHCLKIAQREGYLEEWERLRLPDGQPPRLGELSTVVQTAATSIADDLRDAAIENRQNVIMEGTLQWPGHPNIYLGDPDRPDMRGLLEPDQGYAGYEVYAVEVPQSLAQAQATSRWWDRRAAGDPLARYMPAEGISRLYTSGSNEYGYSRTLNTALGMVNHPHAARFELARLNVLDRMESTTPVEVRFDHEPGREFSVDDVGRSVRQARGTSAHRKVKDEGKETSRGQSSEGPKMPGRVNPFANNSGQQNTTSSRPSMSTELGRRRFGPSQEGGRGR